MGNKVLTAYKVEKQPCCQGLDLRWTCYPAAHNDRPTDPLTVFLFEKKVLDRNRSKDAILETLRRDAQMLQRLRHPNILHVMEPLVEEKATLAFATKPIKVTLAQLLDRAPSELSSLEMKCGLLDIAEAVRFLHQDAKTAHLGLSPSSIFVTEQGRWLLGGFGHAQQGVVKGTAQNSQFNFYAEDLSQMGADPSLKYCAPELTSSNKFGMESDVFSLGLIAYELMSSDRRSLLAALGRYDRSGHQAKLSALLPLRDCSMLPPELVSVLCGMLAPSPEHRVDVTVFLQSEFFQDIHIKALRFLETLSEKDDAQKAQFLKGFRNLLEQPESALTSARILKERVLPQLTRALNYPPLYGHVLHCVLVCLRKPNLLTPEEFMARCWNGMRTLFSAKEIPIEAVTDLVKNLDLLMGLVDSTQAQQVLLPFLLRCLEIPEPTIQNTALEKIPQIHGKFEYRQIKDQILPRMLAVLLRAESTLKARVQILMGINAMFSVFDRGTILETILTACERVQKMERAPALCMVLLSLYDAMSKFLGPRETATKLLPLVCPLLAEESLSAEQWRTQMEVCKKLLNRVETARAKEYATRTDASADVSAALGGAAPKPKMPDEDDNFLAQLGGGGATSSTTASTSSKIPTPQDVLSDFDSLLSAPAAGAAANNPRAPAAGAFDDLIGGGGTTSLPPPAGAFSPARRTANTTPTGGDILSTFGTTGGATSSGSSGFPAPSAPATSSFPSLMAPPGSNAGKSDDLLAMMGPTPQTQQPKQLSALEQLTSAGGGSSNNLFGGGSSAVSSGFQTANFDTSKTGVAQHRVGMANISGDPFADLNSTSTTGAGGMSGMAGMGGGGNMMGGASGNGMMGGASGNGMMGMGMVGMAGAGNNVGGVGGFPANGGNGGMAGMNNNIMGGMMNNNMGMNNMGMMGGPGGGINQMAGGRPNLDPFAGL
ncbi:unnamed protein product [Amoebophrya sp. A25]|nr:unnamed protein product [Amoebophrya sp. A25]|eukprot:GSA25T00005795001.1